MAREPLVLQIASTSTKIPVSPMFHQWVSLTLDSLELPDATLTLRIVEVDEMRSLNRQYREQDKVTNVLSFPFDPIEGIEQTLLGDVVICSSVVEAEALDQKKPAEAHWAHMVIHGILHCCGYDHINPKEAAEMEALEGQLLSALGYPDPYHGYDQ
jgi:probable rRNA maturation factor